MLSKKSVNISIIYVNTDNLNKRLYTLLSQSKHD